MREMVDRLKGEHDASLPRAHQARFRPWAKGTLKRFKAVFTSLEAFRQHKKIEDIKLRVRSYFKMNSTASSL